MTTHVPKFSVVIPTYNRASLLPFAVQSVLNQSFDDFEIVISNGGSTDDTSKVVQSFDEERIRYVESEVRLPVGDNYQAGLNHATGEYITFLSDDDAYTPNLLERVDELIRETDGDIIGYQYCRYYHDDFYDFEVEIPKNSLLISTYDKGVTRFSGDEALDQVLALHAMSSTSPDPRFICPYLSNATYRRDVFDSLQKRRQNLFDMVPADLYLAAAVFFEADSYYCLDQPLLVWSNWEGNSTASAQRAENKLIEHYKRLLNGKELEHTPLKFPFALNCAANAIMEALIENGGNEASVKWDAYFAKTYENFIYLKSVGVDTSEEELEFKRVLAEQPDTIRRAVEAKLSGVAFTSRAFLNSRMPTVAARLRKLRDRNKPRKFHLLTGDAAGFGSVAEAARHVV